MIRLYRQNQLILHLDVRAIVVFVQFSMKSLVTYMKNLTNLPQQRRLRYVLELSYRRNKIKPIHVGWVTKICNIDVVVTMKVHCRILSFWNHRLLVWIHLLLRLMEIHVLALMHINPIIMFYYLFRICLRQKEAGNIMLEK